MSHYIEESPYIPPIRVILSPLRDFFSSFFLPAYFRKEKRNKKRSDIDNAEGMS